VRDRTSKHSPDGRSPRVRDAGGQRDAHASGRGRDGRRTGFAGRREHRGRDRRGDGANDRGSRERGDGAKDPGSRERSDGAKDPGSRERSDGSKDRGSRERGDGV
jgi:hypothetical protein